MFFQGRLCDAIRLIIFCITSQHVLADPFTDPLLEFLTGVARPLVKPSDQVATVKLRCNNSAPISTIDLGNSALSLLSPWWEIFQGFSRYDWLNTNPTQYANATAGIAVSIEGQTKSLWDIAIAYQGLVDLAQLALRDSNQSSYWVCDVAVIPPQTPYTLLYTVNLWRASATANRIVHSSDKTFGCRTVEGGYVTETGLKSRLQGLETVLEYDQDRARQVVEAEFEKSIGGVFRAFVSPTIAGLVVRARSVFCAASFGRFRVYTWDTDGQLRLGVRKGVGLTDVKGLGFRGTVGNETAESSAQSVQNFFGQLLQQLPQFVQTGDLSHVVPFLDTLPAGAARFLELNYTNREQPGGVYFSASVVRPKVFP